MGVMAYPLRYALADLALALSRAAVDAAEVRATAAQAAADMIGDGAGVQLLRDDGRYEAITFHHLDADQAEPLARALDRVGRLPDDDFSAALAASRRPIVLNADGGQSLPALPAIHTAVLCPVIVDNTYAGYLILTRNASDSSYSPAEVELARDIAGELALACSTGRAQERLRASEEKYRRVLETIPEGVLQLDADGVATYANEPIGVVLGLPRAQLVGVSLRGFLDDQGQTELTRRLGE
jgi:two-component system cell cycle sensor histidine kinase/response regulator CckA